jgi:hypothetical protein
MTVFTKQAANSNEENGHHGVGIVVLSMLLVLFHLRGSIATRMPTRRGSIRSTCWTSTYMATAA